MMHERETFLFQNMDLDHFDTGEIAEPPVQSVLKVDLVSCNNMNKEDSICPS